MPAEQFKRNNINALTAFLIVQGASFCCNGYILRIGSQSMYLKRQTGLFANALAKPISVDIYYISATESTVMNEIHSEIVRLTCSGLYSRCATGTTWVCWRRNLTDIDKIGTVAKGLYLIGLVRSALSVLMTNPHSHPASAIPLPAAAPFINRGEDTTQWHLACDLLSGILLIKHIPKLFPGICLLCAEACAFCDKY